MKISTQLKANLRTCASCEWIFSRIIGEHPLCPKCGFVTYGARHVHGDNAYRFKKTQKPWKDRRMKDYESQLNQEIEKGFKDMDKEYETLQKAVTNINCVQTSLEEIERLSLLGFDKECMSSEDRAELCKSLRSVSDKLQHYVYSNYT